MRLKIRRYLIIPDNFSEKLSNAEHVTLTLVEHPNVDSSTTQTLMDILSGMGDDQSLELQILDGIHLMGVMQATNPEVQSGFDITRVEQQAKDQFEVSRENPLVAVIERQPASEAEAKPAFDLSSSFVPGLCVLFVFLSSSAVARGLFKERKSGTLRRFPIIGFGTLSIREHPLVWALTSNLIVLCSTCMGVLIAAISHTEVQAGGLSNALLWVAG